jgi:hypothetical protein
VDDRRRALDEIAALARAHGLTAADIAARLDEPPPPREDRRRDVLVRVLGYIGGTFLFAGVVLFVAMRWTEMTPAARIVITLGSGLAAFAGAFLASRDPRFERVTTPLFLMAAVLEPTGLLVTFDELGSGGEWRMASLVTCGTMALQYAAVFKLLHLSSLLFVSVFFATLFSWTLLDLADAPDTLVAAVLGSSLVLAGIGVDRTPHRAITPLWYLFGATAFLYAAFDMLEDTPIEAAFLAIAIGFVYLSVAVRSRTLLGVAIGALLGYTAWFTNERFADSVGWPLALAVFGIVLIALSALAFRIDRTYLRAARP